MELDGEIHDSQRQQEHDRNRDAALSHLNLRVLRIANREVFEDPDKVLRKIEAAAAEPIR